MTATDRGPPMTAADRAAALVEAEDLTISFQVSARSWGVRPQMLHAVDGISLTVARGESLALVGESGSGKTTVGRAILGLYRLAGGTVRFDGQDLSRLSRGELKRFRRRASMVFQDPYASLNPRMKVGAIIAEPLRAQDGHEPRVVRERVREMLGLVGLPVDSADRFPYAFSGGQRQRIGIARALAAAPEFVVADEPVSALDVSVQGQILNLLARLREELSLTMVFISHNLAVVRHVASRVAVMYLGQLVEVGSRDEVFSEPAHPYTRALLRAIPPPDPKAGWSGSAVFLGGDVPSAIAPPAGCRFHTRCPEALDVCRSVAPEVTTLPSGRTVACHLVSRDPAVPKGSAPADDGESAQVTTSNKEEENQ